MHKERGNGELIDESASALLQSILCRAAQPIALSPDDFGGGGMLLFTGEKIQAHEQEGHFLQAYLLNVNVGLHLKPPILFIFYV